MSAAHDENVMEAGHAYSSGATRTVSPSNADDTVS